MTLHVYGEINISSHFLSKYGVKTMKIYMFSLKFEMYTKTVVDWTRVFSISCHFQRD